MGDHLIEITNDDALAQPAGQGHRDGAIPRRRPRAAFDARRTSANVVTVPDEPSASERDAPRPAARQVVEEVHARHAQQLFGFVRRLGLGDEEASDVAQEALLRLWRVCRDGGAPDRPLAWTFRTAYRLAMDRHRLRRRWRALLDARVSAGGPTDMRDELLAVWSEVDRLPLRQRQVLYLRYRADLPFEDIGHVLGIDTSSARASAARGLASLRDRLAEEDD
jgi:RNA polymerase sigma factor (sigma-70 family)